ncbi:MAG: response regulator, partial [Pseudomonadota bacterium]
HLGSAPGKYVLIAISDTGVGMDSSVKRRVFEPFFTTKEKGKGTGLGLAMVYGIVKNHSGYVNFYSEKGLGTRFNIYLPAVKEGEADITVTRQEELLKGKETILLIDDEDVIRELGKEVLERLGYKVLLAADGVEAIEIYDKNAGQIDLVILDIVMPKAGGKSTFGELRAKNSALKVIISSGYSINGDAQDLLRSGAHAFIQKPYRIDGLSSVIRRVLDE